MKIQAQIKKATEKIKRIEQSGEVEAEYEFVLIVAGLSRNEYLKLARQGLVGHEITLDVGFVQQEFDINGLMER